jgi:hypothetical protein
MQAFLDFFLVMFEPVPVFERVRERPRFLAPWIIISVIAIIVTYLTRPFQAAAMQDIISRLPPEQAAQMSGAGQGGIVGLLVGTPLFVLLMLVIGTGLLWAATAVTGADAKFKVVSSVLAYSMVTYSVVSIITMIILFVKGVGTVHSFADMRPPIGLDFLAPNAGFFAATILNGINPFSIWGVWLAGTGIAITHKTTRTAGYSAAAIAYLIGLVIFAAAINLPMMMMGGGQR